MTTDAAIKAALTMLPVYPNYYTGEDLEYIVYNYTALPQVYAERLPAAARYLVQVHLYLPHKKNPNALKVQISRALSEHGFTWPSITNGSDGDGQHYVFECEYANAGGVYAET